MDLEKIERKTTESGMPKKQQKKMECQVCGRLSRYKYYGVWSCESCKQFFRRIIIRGQLYKCAYKQGCAMTTTGDNCRCCRFNKCLIVGMKPELVLSVEEEQKHFVDFLKEYRQEILTRNQVKSLQDPQDFSQLFATLMPIERAYNRIWDSPATLPPAYANRHENLEELLNDERHNLLTIAQEFPIDQSVGWDKELFLEELEVNGLFSSTHLMEIVVKDWFLAVEATKAMPFFKMLHLDDQRELVGHTFVPITLFTSAFYSHTISAKTVTRANGLQPIAFVEIKKICDDEKIRTLAEQNMCEMVERMCKAGVDYHEFILLLAILFANSNASNISAHGRELLYDESVRYTKVLHKMLQSKLGIFAAAHKFATLMDLLALSFKAKQLYLNLAVYLEVFVESHDVKPFVPKSLRALTL